MCLSKPKIASPQVSQPLARQRTKDPQEAGGDALVPRRTATQTKLTGPRGLQLDILGQILPQEGGGSSSLGA